MLELSLKSPQLFAGDMVPLAVNLVEVSLCSVKATNHSILQY